MKLEVGMYVRTKYGIAKYINNHITKATIYRVIDKKIVYDNIEDWEDCLLDNEILKASHNIIDLIEYDDVLKIIYENKEYISKVVNVLGNKGVQLTADLSVSLGCIEIKSIVTKEQFESMSYKAGD